MPLRAWPFEYGRLRLRAAFRLRLGRASAAEEALSAMLRLRPGDAYALANRAYLRAQLGRTAEAIDDARALVDGHPRRRAADWFNLAFLLESAGRIDEAEAAFRQCVALDPALDRAWYGLGLTLIRLGRLDEAVAALRRNTELQPMSPYGWYQLARVHAQRREPDEARRIIRHLEGFEPRVAAQLRRETGLAP